jgi:hypothetical protein
LTLIFSYKGNPDKLIEKLRQLPGVQDVVIAKEEQTIYLRVDKAHYKQGSAELLIK